VLPERVFQRSYSTHRQYDYAQVDPFVGDAGQPVLCDDQHVRAYLRLADHDTTQTETVIPIGTSTGPGHGGSDEVTP